MDRKLNVSRPNLHPEVFPAIDEDSFFGKQASLLGSQVGGDATPAVANLWRLNSLNSEKR